MKRLLILGIVCVWFTASGEHLLADEAAAFFTEANALYLKGDYKGAVARYEKIVQNGLESGELYFNLGNAYYKVGRIEKAILNYERAKRFIPSDEDLQVNLQIANLQIVDKIDALPSLFVYQWFDALLYLFPVSTLGWLSYVLFLFTLIAFGTFLFFTSARVRRVLLLNGMILGGLLIAMTALFLARSYREVNTQYAIVTGEVVNIKTAPDSRSSDAFVLHKGLKIQILDDVNDWQKIRLTDGKVGWISIIDCEVI